MNDGTRARLLNGVVGVRHSSRNYGMGFVLADCYIVTAAHCLPKWPVQGKYFPGDRLPVTVRAQNDPRAVAAAMVVFLDPIADLAVLDCSGRDEFYASGGEFDKLHSFLGKVQSLRLRGRCLPVGKGIACHVFTSKGRWVSGDATCWRYDANEIQFSKGVPGGTSVAPVFDDSGGVVGVVSSSSNTGDSTIVYLLNTLPARIIREIESAARKRKKIE